MAYGGYYPVSYTPMVQSIQNTQPVAPQPTNAQNALTWVQGEAGAKSFMVAPNNTVLLMDSESDCFYLKSADQSGMPSLRKFKYEEVTQSVSAPPEGKNTTYVTKDEYNAFKDEMKRFMKEFEPDESTISITK